MTITVAASSSSTGAVVPGPVAAAGLAAMMAGVVAAGVEEADPGAAGTGVVMEMAVVTEGVDVVGVAGVEDAEDEDCLFENFNELFIEDY